MADKSFGVKRLNLTGPSGTPTIDSPNNLNLNAISVAISTDLSVGGQVQSNLKIGSSYSVGIGTTVPTSKLHVVGDGRFTGVVTAVSFIGNITGNVIGTASTASFATTAFNLIGTAATASFATTAANLTNAANITTGTINPNRLSGEYNIDITGNSLRSQFAENLDDAANILSGIINPARLSGSYNININGTATTSINVSGGIVSVTSLNVSGVSTLGTVRISSGIITATSGIVTYYGDGSKLQNVVASGVGITISKNGSFVGVGSILNFQNHLDVTVVSGYATVSVNQDSVNYFKSAPSGIITSTNVGIGTTNPQNRLHVYSNTADGISVERSNSQNSVIQYKNTISSMFAGLSTSAIGWGIDQNNNIGTQPYFYVLRNNGEVLVGTATSTGTANQKLQVNSGAYVSGSIGIGTTNPLSTLQVGAASTQAFYVFSDGRVGIGQTNPSGVFVARDDSGTSGFSQIIRAEKRGTTNTNVFRVDVNANSSEIQLIGIGSQASNISIVNGSNITASFRADGNVGIATTTPTSRLHVNGTSLISGISTIGNFRITPVGTGATVGGIGVTYYGDGSQLTSLNAGAGGTTGQIQYNSSGISTGASDFYYINSNNRVGLGTTNPQYKLHVIGDVFISGIVTATSINVGSVGTAAQLNVTSIPSDNVTYPLFVTDATDGGKSVYYDNGISWDATNNVLTVPSLTATTQILLSDSDNLILGAGEDAKLFYDGTGNILNLRLENTANSFILTDAGTTKITFSRSGNADFTGIVTATDFNSTSDIQYKENIKTIENPVDKILQIRGVEFNWKSNNKKSLGVIAQEIENIFPELIGGGEDYKTVNYNGLIGVLIESIKELKQEVEELKKKINS